MYSFGAKLAACSLLLFFAGNVKKLFPMGHVHDLLCRCAQEPVCGSELRKLFLFPIEGGWKRNGGGGGVTQKAEREALSSIHSVSELPNVPLGLIP